MKTHFLSMMSSARIYYVVNPFVPCLLGWRWQSVRNKTMRNKIKSLAVVALAALPLSVHAAAADASDITATATSAFEAVSTLVVAMVGFFIIVRIVKGIRK
jgi:energy-converting hydrogenase Eha subunit C